MTKNEYGEAVIKWVTITVLIAVSLFFVILYRNTFILNNPEGQTEIPPVTSPPVDNDEDDEEDDEEIPVIVGPVITYSTFPRVAITSSNGEFYTNSGGASDEKLMNVIDLGGFYYLILETNSNGRDYRADRDSVAVAKFNHEGTLVNTVTLNANRNEYYLQSKITNNGILIAAKGTGGITYYNVSFDLTSSKAVTADNYSEILMYYTSEHTLMAGVDNKNLVVYAVDGNLNKVFSNTIEFEVNISLLEILPAMYGYSIVVSVNSDTPCAYVTSLNSGGDLLSKSLISSSRVLKFTPTSTGYTMLERSGQTLYLKGVNTSLVQQFRTLIGEGTGGDFYALHNGYVTFIYSDNDTVSKHLGKYGDIITTNDIDFKDVISINSASSNQNAIFFYANVRSHGGTMNTRVINYTTNNIVSYSNVLGGYYQDNAVRIIVKNDLVITFMNTKSNNANFLSNYGGSDIFIFAKKL